MVPSHPPISTSRYEHDFERCNLRMESGRARSIAAATPATAACDSLDTTSIPADLIRSNAFAIAPFAPVDVAAQPGVSRKARRLGLRGAGARGGPNSPG